jgi:hypothetical protein
VGRTCDDGLSCYKDAGGTYRCQPTIKIGMPCTTSEGCEGTATCVKMAATDEKGTCRPPGGVMAPCSEDRALGTSCQLTLGCFGFGSPSAACQPLPESGQRCDPMGLDCLNGRCDTTANPPVCQRKAGGGQTCANNSDCAAGLLCDERKCKQPICL